MFKFDGTGPLRDLSLRSTSVEARLDTSTTMKIQIVVFRVVTLYGNRVGC
jgi:hypothetical protein